MKNKILFISLFVLVVLFISGCGGEEVNIQEETNQDKVNIVDNTQNVNIKDVQETSQLLEIMINSASKENNIGIWDVYEQVGSGFVYLVLDFTIGNPTTQSYDFNPLRTKIVDNKGYSYEKDVSSYDLKPYFDSRKIPLGSVASGKLSYAIPRDAEGLKLIIHDYSNNILAEVRLE